MMQLELSPNELAILKTMLRRWDQASKAKELAQLDAEFLAKMLGFENLHKAQTYANIHNHQTRRR